MEIGPVKPKHYYNNTPFMIVEKYKPQIMQRPGKCTYDLISGVLVNFQRLTRHFHFGPTPLSFIIIFSIQYFLMQ